MTPSGQHWHLALLLCLIGTAAGNLSGFTEEPFERVGKSDGYCSRILRAQSNRKEVNSEFRLRVEGDPESYQPGSTYRGWRNYAHGACCFALSVLFPNKQLSVALWVSVNFLLNTLLNTLKVSML